MNMNVLYLGSKMDRWGIKWIPILLYTMEPPLTSSPE
jgi:hypothetical protein